MAFHTALRDFYDHLAETFARAHDAHPEDQLKTPLQNFLKNIGPILGLEVASYTEARAPEVHGRPDIGVTVANLLCGYIELKAPNVNVNPRTFRGANKKQWEKFRNIPNLIYTNGTDWHLFRNGEQIDSIVRFAGDPTISGAEAVTEENARTLERLMRDFLSWEPILPANPRGLAQLIAPVCRLIRDDVLKELDDPESPITILAGEWRDYLFPDADDERYADAYAQTLTYALLLARLQGEETFNVSAAADNLRSGHALLARVLELFIDPEARERIRVGADVLERLISAIPAARLLERYPDLWLYFYEDFLSAYDNKLRKDYGVYYTPAEVVRCQVNLISEVLETDFSKPFNFADEGVTFLDPGCGTGTYPIAAIHHALESVREQQGEGAVPQRASQMARNMHAFEILVGPYAVAHLRLTQAISVEGGALPEDGVHVYLHDALESPFAEPPGQRDMFHLPLREENRRARRVKEATRVLVCFGNPPYNRQQIDPEESGVARKGGWVRFGDEDDTETAILQDFLNPAREEGAGVHLKNLYNDYVYFWRLALWKVLETVEDGGIVSFITASSYLRGPGFVGMREVMRRLFDNVWIIDLEGDNLGARKTENIFNIQTPVAIAVGVRRGALDTESPAEVRYTKIIGTRKEKLKRLDEVTRFDDLEWRECYDGWRQPFLPRGHGAYFEWARITDIFPWQYSGVQFKRTWPIAPTEDTLRWRWRTFAEADIREKPQLFRQTRSRRIDRVYSDYLTGEDLPNLCDLGREECPQIQRYAYRSFDRQHAFADNRFADRPRAPLWHVAGPNQVYMTSLLTGVLGRGPAATITATPPDLHHFRGSFGGKDVIPLWRDPDGREANVTLGVLERLEEEYDRSATPSDLFAYAYAILASPVYVSQYSEELVEPGPRLPLTRDATLFARLAELGRRLIWLHTFGDRMVPDNERSGRVLPGEARFVRPIPETEAGYPEDYAYDSETRTLRVGAGEIRPVAPEVFDFSVSGFKVVRRWLDYRKRGGAGRRSSALDRIEPRMWGAALNDELLNVLWVLEHTLSLYPELEEALREVIAGPLFTAGDFPAPTEEEQTAPDLAPTPDDQQRLL